MTNIIHATSKVSERVVVAVILVNVGVVVAAWLVEGHEALFERFHNAILAFFVAELLMRLRAGGWGFWRGGCNCLDTAVIMASLLPVFGGAASVLRIARAARMLHLLRHLPHLRHQSAPRRADWWRRAPRVLICNWWCIQKARS